MFRVGFFVCKVYYSLKTREILHKLSLAAVMEDESGIFTQASTSDIHLSIAPTTGRVGGYGKLMSEILLEIHEGNLDVIVC